MRNNLSTTVPANIYDDDAPTKAALAYEKLIEFQAACEQCSHDEGWRTLGKTPLPTNSKEKKHYDETQT